MVVYDKGGVMVVLSLNFSILVQYIICCTCFSLVSFAGCQARVCSVMTYDGELLFEFVWVLFFFVCSPRTISGWVEARLSLEGG